MDERNLVLLVILVVEDVCCICFMSSLYIENFSITFPIKVVLMFHHYVYFFNFECQAIINRCQTKSESFLIKFFQTFF